MPLTTTQSTINDKALYVNNMFAKIASKYDLLNNLMTCGLHNLWKIKTIKLAIKENPNMIYVLDLCSGTGDLALITNKLLPNSQVVCIDSCQEMLDIANKKFRTLKLDNLQTKLQDIDEIDFPNSSTDLITIGFGLRNLVNRERCIQKAYSLLKPGGVFACIDLGHPTNRLWGNIYFLFFFKLIPFIGKLFAKNKEAYTYLPNSLLTWYTQKELKNLLMKHGFKKTYYKNLMGGASTIHIAVK